MADISTYINAFKNAVYGEDVRDAMVGLANALNNEADNALSKALLYTVCSDLATGDTYFMNGRFIGTDGSMTSNPNYLCTHLLPCMPNIYIKYKACTDNPNVLGISFYDKNATFISGQSNVGSIENEYEVLSPANTTYFRLTIRATQTLNNVYAVNKITTSHTGLSWLIKGLSDDLNTIKSTIDQVGTDNYYNRFLALSNINSLHNINCWANKVIDSTTGQLANTTGSHISCPIYLSNQFIINKVNSDVGLAIGKYKNSEFITRELYPSTDFIEITPNDEFDSYRLMIYPVTQASNSYTMSQMLESFDIIESRTKYEFDAIKVALDPTYFLNESAWIKGRLNTNGSIADARENKGITTKKYFDQKVYLKFDGNVVQICYYYTRSDGTSARSSWNRSGYIEIDEPRFRISVVLRSYVTAAEYDINDTLQYVEYLSYVPESGGSDDGGGSDDFAKSIITAYTPYKIAHYSVDDVKEVIKDLINNSEVYQSPFECPILQRLKAIHDSTGLTVTLNTFNTLSTDSTYSISNLPEKQSFKQAFQDNKDWLKFAFHAESDLSNYDTSQQIVQSYNTFVNAIYKLTGDYDCIDRFIRLGFFGGTLENILLLKECDYGVLGLLAADTTNRSSYYLNSYQNSEVQSHGMYIDSKNELLFLKSITRLDSGISTPQNEIENNLVYHKCLELFSHEGQNVASSNWLNYVSSMATWLKEQGFVFAFPSLIYPVNTNLF